MLFGGEGYAQAFATYVKELRFDPILLSFLTCAAGNRLPV
jgi:hypothetical protein